MNLSFHHAGEIKHAYIICAPTEKERYDAALQIAAAAVCKEKNQIPCGACSACRKVFADKDHPNHPDVKIIRKGEGDAKNAISVDQVREVVADSVILPNESERKIYIFLDGEAMNLNAQNAALKLLEEPPKGVILVLCSGRPDVFLPTVRSRCTELTIASPESKEEISEQRKLGREYLKILEKKNRIDLIRFCEESSGMSIPEASEFVSQTQQLIADLLCKRGEAIHLSREELFQTEQLMEKCESYLKVNVSVKQVFGLIEVSSSQKK